MQYGNTPIKLAAEKENIHLMQLLVDSGADVNKPDKVRTRYSTILLTSKSKTQTIDKKQSILIDTLFYI